PRLFGRGQLLVVCITSSFGSTVTGLLRLDISALISAALALVLFMMIVNALTNYIMFRARADEAVIENPNELQLTRELEVWSKIDCGHHPAVTLMDRQEQE